MPRSAKSKASATGVAKSAKGQATAMANQMKRHKATGKGQMMMAASSKSTAKRGAAPGRRKMVRRRAMRRRSAY